MPYKRWRVPPNVPWPGRGGDDPLAAQLLRHAGDILARAPTHGPERHAASDRADLLLQQALGVNSSTSTVWSHLSTPPFNSSSLARPGCRDFRARRDELRAHLARLGVEPASARVDAGRGVQTAMQRALSRCINDGEPFRVVTLGCSMTEGQMSCFGRDPAGACWGGCVEYRWCSKLERNLARLLPCRVAVVCGKRGQGGSTYAFRFNETVARHNPALVVSHLAHCDVYGGIESPEVRQSLAAAESVTRRALALGASFVHLQPAEPAFVHGRSLCSPPEGVRGLHLSLALRYRAPAISLPAAVCGSDPLLGPLRHWTGGCSPSAASCKAGIDRWGAKCWLHPGPHLHHIYAALLTDLVLEAAGGACDRGAPPAQVVPEPQPVANKAELARFETCSRKSPTSLDFSGQCGRPLRAAPADWQCFADAPGRQGWIARAAERPGTISFPLLLNGNNATLSVGFLRSYEGFGNAQLWLDDDVGRAMSLNGTWDSPTSEPDLLVVSAATLCGPTCAAASATRGKKGNHRHAAHVRMLPEPQRSTRKFKLLLLESC